MFFAPCPESGVLTFVIASAAFSIVRWLQIL